MLSRPYLLWNCTIFSLQAEVATAPDAVLMSRLHPYVATLFSFEADVATASDAGLMSRLHPDVATASRCRDIVPSFSSIPGCLSLSFVHFQLILFSIKLHLRLEFH